MREPPLEELIDYAGVLRAARSAGAEVVAYLCEELPHLWREAYVRMTPRPTRVDRVRRGSFEYLYDDLSSLEARGLVPASPTAEARLVAVFGCSTAQVRSRSGDDGRLRGFVGRTDAEFGREWDKGHFMGHALGGGVAGMELNVFVQRRALNRGWSVEGKTYRGMERYCRNHPGTFCFSRPFYADDTSKPSFVEFGVLRGPGDLWVERFDNRGATARENRPR